MKVRTALVTLGRHEDRKCAIHVLQVSSALMGLAVDSRRMLP